MPIISTDISRGAHLLREGKLVAFATETVYGLGADAGNAAAIAELYRRKNRPPTHPVIVHVHDFAVAGDWVTHIPPPARVLAARFTPGALTFLLPRAEHVNPALCGGGAFVALRVPSHPQAQRLLREFGGGVAAPSANKHGCVSPTSAAHVAADFSDFPELFVLDGGDCSIGIESTIVGFSATFPFSPYIARPGGISGGDLSHSLAAAGEHNDIVSPPSPIAAPGNMPRHYAPRTPLRLASAADIMALSKQGGAVAVLSRQKPPALDSAHWRPAASSPDCYARNVYKYLRELDALRQSSILVEFAFSDSSGAADKERWLAIEDRLRRAAAKR